MLRIWRLERPTAGQEQRSRRERWAAGAGLATVLALVGAFALSDGPRFLMPGPLSSPHGGMAACSACHTKSGSGVTSWLHGLVSGDPLSDSKACLTCHKMPQTAFNAHGASIAVLGASRKRVSAAATETPVPSFARAQAAAFPVEGVTERGLFCATCHQEHKGGESKLAMLSNEQCQSCHAVKFDGFDGDHPEFKSYPFRRRTRIIYDHAGHFGKHFPESAKKDPALTVPATCATCHDSSKDRRVMAVASFDQTCSACHLGQILGRDRATGPNGIAVLTVPGLDVQTLRKKKAPIGEWPEASEAELTAFMKVLIARGEKGRGVISAVDKLNLQDLGGASDLQIKAVTELVWEIKQLFHRLIMGKASDVFAEAATANRLKPSANLIADITASLPRDVIVGAYRQWLPNLASEIATGPPAGVNVVGLAATPPVMANTPQAKATAPDRSGRMPDPSMSKPQDSKREPSAKPVPAAPHLPTRSTNQTDDLLTLSEEEQRAVAALAKGRGQKPPVAGSSKSTASVIGAPAPAGPKASGPPAASTTAPQSAKAEDNAAARQFGDSDVQGSVDPETWADAGGWYRQDFAISYRPTGHKDKFVASWIELTGSLAAAGSTDAAARVFDALTAKDAQGACAKCHSVDEVEGTGRRMNFVPAGLETKPRRFTRFIHEPHLAQAERGCQTCHELQKGKPVLDGYKKGDPFHFVGQFAAVTKDTCTTCHTSRAVRQDCLTCHAYHVNEIARPTPRAPLPKD